MILSNGITINNKHSYTDFDLYISEKNIGLPEKEIITDTVPFMSGYYDFSNILGGSVFKERVLEYTFDLLSTATKSLEELKTDIAMWLMNVHNAEIFDDELEGFHFVGSFESCEWAEDDEYGELKVTFRCQPFKIANEETEIVLETGTNAIDYDGLPVNLSAISTGSTSITIGSASVSVGTTKTTLSVPLTNAGLEVGCSGEETVTLNYRKEVI